MSVSVMGSRHPKPISPDSVIGAAIKKHATVVIGEVGGNHMDIMLDSGLSVSLVRRDLLLLIRDSIKLPITTQPQLGYCIWRTTTGWGTYKISQFKLKHLFV